MARPTKLQPLYSDEECGFGEGVHEEMSGLWKTVTLTWPLG